MGRKFESDGFVVREMCIMVRQMFDKSRGRTSDDKIKSVAMVMSRKGDNADGDQTM